MERPLSGLIMPVPGITFIALGVLIIVWPSILPWLVAAACILAGGGPRRGEPPLEFGSRYTSAT